MIPSKTRACAARSRSCGQSCLKWQVWMLVGTLVMPGLAAFAKAPAAE